MNNTKVILGFIAGASLGAIAGILFAPDKGSSTRKKIIDETNDLRSIVNDWATDFIKKMKHADEAIETETGKAPDMKLNTMG